MRGDTIVAHITVVLLVTSSLWAATGVVNASGALVSPGSDGWFAEDCCLVGGFCSIRASHHVANSDLLITINDNDDSLQNTWYWQDIYSSDKCSAWSMQWSTLCTPAANTNLFKWIDLLYVQVISYFISCIPNHWLCRLFGILCQDQRQSRNELFLLHMTFPKAETAKLQYRS